MKPGDALFLSSLSSKTDYPRPDQTAVTTPKFDFQNVRNFAKTVFFDAAPAIGLVGLAVLSKKGPKVLRTVNRLKPQNRTYPSLVRGKYSGTVVERVKESVITKPGKVVSRKLIDRAKTEIFPEGYVESLAMNPILRRMLIKEVKQTLPTPPQSTRKARKIAQITYFRMGGPLWISELKRNLMDTQAQLQISRLAKSADRQAARAFLKGYNKAMLALLILTTAGLSYYQEKDKPKKPSVDARINESVKEVQAKGKEMGDLLDDQLAAQAKREEELTDAITSMISKLPEEERALFANAHQEIMETLGKAKGDAEAEIREVLDKFSQIALRAQGDESVSSVKEVSSHLSTALLAVGTGVVFSRVQILKQGIAALVKMGFSQRVINKLLIGSVAMGTAEVLKAGTAQTVKKQDVHSKTNEVLSELGIDPTKEEDLSPDEEKLSEGLTNVSLSVVSKILSLMVENPVISDMTETLFNSSFKVSSSEYVEKPLTHPELDAAVVEALKPTMREIDILRGRISRIEHHGVEELNALQREIQVALDALQPKGVVVQQPKDDQQSWFFTRAYRWMFEPRS